MLFLLLLFGVLSCSKVQDQQVEPETVPEHMVALVGERVPGAVGVNFTPLIPRKLWTASAYASSTMHLFFVSKSEILEHFRGKSLNSQPIRDIVSAASFGQNGIIGVSWISEISKPGEIRYQSEYSLRGQRYLLTCLEKQGSPSRYEMRLYPRVYNHFETTNYADLPEKIQALFTARDFIKAVMTEEGNRVYFHLELNKGTMEVTDDMRLFFSDFDADVQTITEEQLPQAARDWLADNPAPARLSEVTYVKFTFRNTTGYRVVFSDEAEKKYVHFDNLGKNIYHYYSLTAVR